MTATCIPTFVRRNAAASAMTAVLDEAGIAWTITFGGRHPKLRFEHGGRQHSHPISKTPGDPEAHRHAARDIRRVLAAAPTEQQEVDMEAASTNSEITLSEIGLIPHDGEPRARDVDIAEALGFERPRKIRELIERNLSEIEAFGTCPTVGRVIRGNPVSEYLLNEEQALLIATISQAPNAPAVRAMLIRTFVAWRRGQLQPVGGGEDVGALLDLMGEQFDRVLAAVTAIAAKGGLCEEDMRRLLRQHCEWEQRQHGRLRDEVHAGAGRVIKTLRAEPASASLGDDVDLDAGYRACGIEGPIPARRKLSARVTNMVDAYCRKHRIPVGQIVVRGVEVKVWPRSSFQAWFAQEGGDFIADHIRRATAGEIQPRPGEQNVFDFPQPGAR